MGPEVRWLELHRELRGKVETAGKVDVRSREDLAAVYFPGSMEPAKAIFRNPELSFQLTARGNSVAIVSDGSAVMGIGNVGPCAALPVLEGKALLFRQLADINGVPVAIKARRTQEIVDTVQSISPNFAAVDLEDISAPRCFDVENALREQMNIPVLHDDQHGTAIALLASLINGCRMTGKRLGDLRILIQGAGYVGIAFAKLLQHLGLDRRYAASVREIVVCDSRGPIYEGRGFLNRAKEEIARRTNRSRRAGPLESVLRGMDVFVGASAANVLNAALVRAMNADPILLALANPVPEITREEGYRAGAALVCTGLQDDPNQITNVLVFPGLFRGALDARAYEINSLMKLHAAYALAELVREPARDRLLPDPLDRATVRAVAAAVRNAAHNTGVACVLGGEPQRDAG
ncbi:MAG: NAD-dependent malic enzyme [Acidobacteria bacterium]|nr:MAG: NAD-dependent malic enzyme [Acidobacteriota bacterium]